MRHIHSHSHNSFMSILNVIGNDIVFNHDCTNPCQIKPNKHEVYSRLRCQNTNEVCSTFKSPVREDYERLQDTSRMSAETLSHNPYFLLEFCEVVRRVFTVNYQKKLELIKNLHVSMKHHPMDILYTFTANVR